MRRSQVFAPGLCSTPVPAGTSSPSNRVGGRSAGSNRRVMLSNNISSVNGTVSENVPVASRRRLVDNGGGIQRQLQQQQPVIVSRVASKISKRKASSPKRLSSTKKSHSRKAVPAGVRALQEIRQLQKSTDLLIRKLPFSRVVREIAHNLDRVTGQDKIKEMRWQAPAIACLHEASEAFLCDIFRMINLIAMHSRRVTVMPRDLDLLSHLRPDIGRH